jgi:hypothetical protein
VSRNQKRNRRRKARLLKKPWKPHIGREKRILRIFRSMRVKPIKKRISSSVNTYVNSSRFRNDCRRYNRIPEKGFCLRIGKDVNLSQLSYKKALRNNRTLLGNPRGLYNSKIRFICHMICQRGNNPRILKRITWLLSLSSSLQPHGLKRGIKKVSQLCWLLS